MAKLRERFVRNPARPTRNYLAWVVVSIVALCLCVGLVLVFASEHLDIRQRWALIAFLVLFPFFGLSISIWLILRHSRRLAVSENDDLIGWQIMSPEHQRHKLNAKVTTLAVIMGIPQSQFSDLRSAYIVAEDLALRKVEQESKLSLMRHVAIERAEFDAVLINRDVITFIEVAFLVTPDIEQEKINAILKKLDYAKKTFSKIRPHSQLKLMLALVTQLDKAAEAKLPFVLKDKLANTPVDVVINPLDFEELQKNFAAG